MTPPLPHCCPGWRAGSVPCGGADQEQPAHQQNRRAGRVPQAGHGACAAAPGPARRQGAEVLVHDLARCMRQRARAGPLQVSRVGPRSLDALPPCSGWEALLHARPRGLGPVAFAGHGPLHRGAGLGSWGAAQRLGRAFVGRLSLAYSPRKLQPTGAERLPICDVRRSAGFVADGHIHDYYAPGR
jgi:hypothetical protein